MTLLGTGGSAGVPMVGGADGCGDWGACDPAEPRNRRTRASITVSSASGTLLVDTGPELRCQLLACAVPRVDAVLYTHTHADHIVGLDDLRILNRIAGRPLQAFGTQRTLDDLAVRFDYAFRPWQPPGFFRPVLVPCPVAPGETWAMAGHDVLLLDQDHGFTRSLGMRIGGFGYSTDALDMPEESFDALGGLDVWVVGCFQRTPHRTHAWIARIVDWVERLRPRRTILTHMGTDMDWATLRRRLPAGIEPGYDGQVIELDAGGV